jgi:hypothetical protein
MRQPATTTGRKRATYRKTNQKIKQNEASGLTPLDYILAVIRNPKAPAELRFEAAKSAAPYAHPMLAPISLDVVRLLGQLFAVKFDADPAER